MEEKLQCVLQLCSLRRTRIRESIIKSLYFGKASVRIWALPHKEEPNQETHILRQTGFIISRAQEITCFHAHNFEVQKFTQLKGKAFCMFLHKVPINILALTSPLRPERQEICQCQGKAKWENSCFVGCTEFQNGIFGISAEQNTIFYRETTTSAKVITVSPLFLSCGQRDIAQP